MTLEVYFLIALSTAHRLQTGLYHCILFVYQCPGITPNHLHEQITDVRVNNVLV